MAPFLFVYDHPATPFEFINRISRIKLPWATREYNSSDLASFKKIVPRSHLIIEVVIPTSASNASSNEFVIARSLLTCNNKSESCCFVSVLELVFVFIFHL